MTTGVRTDVVVEGIGQTTFSKRSGMSVAELGLRAALAAMADAGITGDRIDGVVPLGGQLFTEDLMMGLGLGEQVFDAVPAPGGNAGLGGVRLARTAIRAGEATRVLVVFARNGASDARIATRVTQLPGQELRAQLERPYGWTAPAEWYAMICRRHMALHGTTKDAMAAVALTMRAHAQANPAAMMHGRPMTRADYDAAPMIVDPYQRYDCCLETDGAVALLISARTAESSTRSIAIEGLACARPPSPDDLTNRSDWFRVGLTSAAPAAYAEAGVGPEDLDAAMIYDCFTFEVLHQIEELGLCERGGSSDFVLSGAIGLGGRLPVNTHGGLLSEGHLLGLGHVAEAVRQLRAECGSRQIPRARRIAVTGWGDWGDGSLAILGT
jgi:acetyl-CoA acetyltransferase